MAGVEGIEPSLTVLETAVIPLDHTPILLTGRSKGIRTPSNGFGDRRHTLLTIPPYLLNLHSKYNGRGRRNRTLINGFGDRCHAIRPYPHMEIKLIYIWDTMENS